MWFQIRRIGVLLSFFLLFMPSAFAGTKVSIETNYGVIKVDLADEKAPVSVANFLSYVDSSFYTGTVFHRVIKGFMIQGGGFTVDGLTKKETNAPIRLESPSQTGLSNARGTIAMARTSIKDSATSQFFINVVDNGRLDRVGGGYAVFGRVIAGMDVVDKIKAVSTGSQKGMANVPKDPVVIIRVKRIR